MSFTCQVNLAQGPNEDRKGDAMEMDLKTLAAALAIGLSAIATALVQGKIGSAAVGALVEKKE